jgi:hypothetical protein
LNDEQTAGHAERQADHADKGMAPMPKQIPVGRLEVVREHRCFLLGGFPLRVQPVCQPTNPSISARYAPQGVPYRTPSVSKRTEKYGDLSGTVADGTRLSELPRQERANRNGSQSRHEKRLDDIALV